MKPGRPVRRFLESAAVDALLEREDCRRGERRDRWEMMEIRNPRGDRACMRGVAGCGDLEFTLDRLMAFGGDS
jgi:hypothetical protein